ncbi:MAG: hypothetical protein HON53_03885 [Planctomycetaceae bacterium]|jgi:hypothetical protein|nr:hypothetical protein [Planctomycetaceae bacterium]MBT6154156.1 hypothetical protein [Planctomycetaceae bacterium]MBT6487847.1 hypothetical protein [Planctomycetaceae bacterium]MBT6495691.1 hypothetical protein [Planctomycetaceae bacterium]
MKQALLSIISARIGIAATVCLAAVAFAPAQDNKQESQKANRQDSAIASTYLFVIRDDDLHRELRLSDKQVESIRKVTDKIDGPLWSTRNKSFAEGSRVLLQLVTQAEAGLAGILSPSDQLRLKQIVLQVQGPKAILSSTVAKRLNLSDEQESKIQKTIDETAQSLADNQKQLNSAAKESTRRSLSRKSSRLRSDEKSTILSHLTRTQRSRWMSMIGRSVDTSKMGTGIAFKAPELEQTGSWVNSKPLKISNLEGQVVAVHFYAFQ